jgi:hypothetical protein
MSIKISQKVLAKLTSKQPPVTPTEIEQCFVNRSGIYLEDTREEHQSDPPTRWFVAETFYGRKLKVAFIVRGEDLHIRTAYDANPEEIRIYSKYGN